ncbi:MAG: cation diffusion facilitator family transporter [Thermodesulfobacteriota bacterium]
MVTDKPLTRVAGLGLAVAVALLLLKLVAYYLTGSKAILSDALESIINVVSGLFLLFSLAVSAEPADADHPYGHGKIEFFAAGLEGGLISLAAILIFIEAVPAFFSPEPPRSLDTGILLVVAAGLVNLGVGWAFVREGRRVRSEALAANGQHLLADFVTSAGVILGLVLVRLTGAIWLDPLTACLVAAQILFTGYRLVRAAVGSLMDTTEPRILERVVAALNSIRQPGMLCPHALRVLRSGRRLHLDLHVSLPRNWTLEQVHAQEKAISQALLAALEEEGEAMLHLDPCDPSCCRCCTLESCPLRSSPFAEETPWTTNGVTAKHVNACPRRLESAPRAAASKGRP